jgi:hypothetical protein
MTGFFECAPIIGRHSTAVLLTNHTKPSVNTRFVKNNTFFFAIFHAFRVIKRSTHWSNRDGFKLVKSRVWCHKARVTHWPNRNGSEHAAQHHKRLHNLVFGALLPYAILPWINRSRLPWALQPIKMVRAPTGRPNSQQSNSRCSDDDKLAWFRF